MWWTVVWEFEKIGVGIDDSEGEESCLLYVTGGGQGRGGNDCAAVERWYGYVHPVVCLVLPSQ